MWVKCDVPEDGAEGVFAGVYVQWRYNDESNLSMSDTQWFRWEYEAAWGAELSVPPFAFPELRISDMALDGAVCWTVYGLEDAKGRPRRVSRVVELCV